MVVSTKTLKITQQLLSLFISQVTRLKLAVLITNLSQLNAALISMILPLSLLFFPMLIDIHKVPVIGIFTLRLVVTVSICFVITIIKVADIAHFWSISISVLFHLEMHWEYQGSGKHTFIWD